jgi:hypothetical protein
MYMSERLAGVTLLEHAVRVELAAIEDYPGAR